MKKRWYTLVFISILYFSLLGCANDEKSTGHSQEAIAIHATQTDPRLEKMSTKLNEFTFDLDGDGKKETIELHTAAGRDQNGNMAWDDGQDWLLVVVDGNKYYPLFQQYVQLGTVYFTVLDDQKGKVIITVMVDTGAGMKIVSFTYDSDQKGYRGEVIYNTGGNQVFSAIRSY